MLYSETDKFYVRTAAQNSRSLHVQKLVEFVRADEPYAALFNYGKKYLPIVKNPTTGKIDLSILTSYKPEIVEYFDILSEIPSLPPSLKDLATDLAVYANGTALEIDNYYQNFDVENSIEEALGKTPKPAFE